MGFFEKLFHKKRIEPELPEEQERSEQKFIDRDSVNLHDSYERERYVMSLLEQIKDAQEAVNLANEEYKTVDLYLTDMEEVEYIKGKDKETLLEHAKAIQSLEGTKLRYEEKKGRMSDADFAKMERLSDETDEGVKKLREAEEYQEAIRHDLQKIEGEKQACLYRKLEAKTSMENLRGMVIISICAVFACLLILSFMQFALQMKAQIGFIITAAAAAIALTAMYMSYQDAKNENIRASRSLNKLILLQNRVKIRYINNTNLLDYLYLKYGITSAKELAKLSAQYQDEREERMRFQEAKKDMTFSQEQLVHILRKHKLHDPLIWLHQVDAIIDPKEMVEVRHALILRRQKIRSQIEFNTNNAQRAQQEIRDIVGDYPKYAKEVLKMVSDFEE